MFIWFLVHILFVRCTCSLSVCFLLLFSVYRPINVWDSFLFFSFLFFHAHKTTFRIKRLSAFLCKRFVSSNGVQFLKSVLNSQCIEFRRKTSKNRASYGFNSEFVLLDNNNCVTSFKLLIIIYSMNPNKN